MKVGTKQLKNQLSRYLLKAQAGEVVHVTTRGRVIAELRGINVEETTDDERLRELDAVGLITAGSGKFRDVKPVRLKGSALASTAILEDRG